MNDLLVTLYGQLKAQSVPETAAVLLAIFYLLLVIRENGWCWVCAFVSSGIYVWLFVEARLYMESLLYVFYCGMAVFGWWQWHYGNGESHRLEISRKPLTTHLVAVSILMAMAGVSGWLLHNFTDAAWPYVDSMTTFAAIWATYLVARKVFENWWYWLAIDLVSIVIYWSRGLELTAVLFVVYVLLIPVGMLQWRRSMSRRAPA